MLFLGSARPHGDLAVVPAFSERFGFRDLARGARVRGDAVRPGRDGAAAVAKAPDQVAIRAAQTKGFRLGFALGRPIHGKAVGAGLAVIGDRAPQLLLADARGAGVDGENRKSEEQAGCGDGSHRYLTRARMARSSPWMVVGYMRPPMISLSMPIDHHPGTGARHASSHDFLEYADRLAIGPDLLRLGVEPDRPRIHLQHALQPHRARLVVGVFDRAAALQDLVGAHARVPDEHELIVVAGLVHDVESAGAFGVPAAGVLPP